jgi:uncharacterized spore protein YtfJ
VFCKKSIFHGRKNMEKKDLEGLVTTTLGEIEKVLGSKTVVGDPITIGDTTIIPLISVGFGFGGAGGGTGESKDKGEGFGGGAGGGVRPIAIIIIDKDGARIEPIKGGLASALEKLGGTVPEIMEIVADKWGGKKDKEG